MYFLAFEDYHTIELY